MDWTAESRHSHLLRPRRAGSDLLNTYRFGSCSRLRFEHDHP